MLKSNWLFIGLIIFLSLPLVLPFLMPGLPITHDGVWVPVRLAEMIRELKDFQIPPRMSGYLNHGFGYPLFNFTYPFPYYLGTIFYLLGFGLVGSTKIIFALTVPLSGVFIYLLSKNLWKSNTAGLVSAVLYLYLPYRLVDLFARGSVGESISFVLFPAILYFALKKKTVLLAISIAILITSHNIMAILFMPILIVFALILKTNIWPSLILGLGASAFFWLPALVEKNSIALSKTPIADRALYFLKPLELIVPKWGYGLPTNPDGFGYQLGIPQAIVFVLTTVLAVVKKEKLPLVFISLILLMVFMLFSVSNPFWQLPFLKEINYPWTLLAPIGFLTSLVSGFLVTNKYTKILAICLAFGAIIFCLPHAKPASNSFQTDDFYRSLDATTTSSDELMPLWVKEKPTERKISSNVEFIKDSSNKIIAKITLTKDQKLAINKIDYPGWAWNAPHTRNSNGLTLFDLKKGTHILEGKFMETPLRKLANAISIVSVLVLGSLVFKRLWLKNSSY